MIHIDITPLYLDQDSFNKLYISDNLYDTISLNSR